MSDLPILVAQAVQDAGASSILGPVIGGLINAGGMGILAAALLWLHRESLSAFRTELKESRESFRTELKESRDSFSVQSASERQQCAEHFKQTLEVAERNHSTTLEAIAQINRGTNRRTT